MKYKIRIGILFLQIFLIGCASLKTSIEKGKIEDVKQRIENGEDINKIIEVAEEDSFLRVNVYKAIFEKHTRISDAYSMTALQVACKCGNLEIAKYLVAKGAEINPTGGVQTPLMWAISSRNFELVKYLIEKGANVNSRIYALKCNNEKPDEYRWERVEDGVSVIMFALDKPDILEYLLNKGAKLNIRMTLDFSIPNIFHSKSIENRIETLITIATAGYLHKRDPNIMKCIEILLKNGENINNTNSDGKNVFSIIKDFRIQLLFGNEKWLLTESEKEELKKGHFPKEIEELLGLFTSYDKTKIK